MLLAVVMWRLLLGSQQFTSSWGTKSLRYDWRSCTSVWDFGGTWCDLSESWPLFFCGALVSQPQVCSWNEPLRLADKQSFDFCGQLRNNYASDSGGVLPLVRSQQCAWRGVFIASFLFRHSTDATSLVFEDCLFEANSVGGVGGGAGHITGTVWASELQLVAAGSPELVTTDVLVAQAAVGPYTFHKCWFIGQGAMAGQGADLNSCWNKCPRGPEANHQKGKLSCDFHFDTPRRWGTPAWSAINCANWLLWCDLQKQHCPIFQRHLGRSQPKHYYQCALCLQSQSTCCVFAGQLLTPMAHQCGVFSCRGASLVTNGPADHWFSNHMLALDFFLLTTNHFLCITKLLIANNFLVDC